MNSLNPNLQYTDRAAYAHAYGEGIHAKTQALARLMSAAGIHRICSAQAAEELLLRTALLCRALNHPIPDFFAGLFRFRESEGELIFTLSDLNLHLGLEISHFPFDFFGRDNGWFPGKTKGILEFARLTGLDLPRPFAPGNVTESELNDMHAAVSAGLSRVDHYALAECARRRLEQIRSRWKVAQSGQHRPFDPAQPLAALHLPAGRLAPVLEEFQPEIRDSAYDDAYLAWLNASDRFDYEHSRVREDGGPLVGRVGGHG
jgi:hypothetical protein